MENVKEQAAAYAAGKFENAVNKLIEQAYIDGYNAGCVEAGKASLAQLNDDEWVDLGLPSGTLWSKDYLRDENGDIIYMPYEKALQYDLPTYEQFQELFSKCVFDWNVGLHYWTCLGPNGNSIRFYEKIGEGAGTSLNEFYMWLEKESNSSRTAVKLYNNSSGAFYHLFFSLFTGYRLPVRLVKAK